MVIKLKDVLKDDPEKNKRLLISIREAIAGSAKAQAGRISGLEAQGRVPFNYIHEKIHSMSKDIEDDWSIIYYFNESAFKT